MTELSIYDDIARRTGGDIYIGIVGPVRTGKSTFIKRFMETLVLPNIEDVYVRERADSFGRTMLEAGCAARALCAVKQNRMFIIMHKITLL